MDIEVSGLSITDPTFPVARNLSAEMRALPWYFWVEAAGAVDDGTGVASSVADYSGNGRAFAQATQARRPTIVANAINGQPALRFSPASPKRLDGSGSFANGDHTKIVIVKVAASGAQQPFLGRAAPAANKHQFQFGADKLQVIYSNATQSGSGTTTIVSSSQTFGTWRTYAASFDDTAKIATMYAEGTLLATQATASAITSFATPMYVGADDTYANGLGGDIVFVGLLPYKLYDGTHAAAIEVFNAYRKDRWGL